MRSHRCSPVLPAALPLVAALALLLAACGSDERKRAFQPDAKDEGNAEASESVGFTPKPASDKDKPDKESADRGKPDKEPPAKDKSDKGKKDDELLVLQVVDPRLPRLDPEQLQTALTDAEDLFRQAPRAPKVRYRLGPTFHLEVFFDRYREIFAQKEFVRAREAERLTGDAAGFAVLEADLRQRADRVDERVWRAHFAEAPADLRTPEQWTAYISGAFQKRYRALTLPQGTHPALIWPERPETSSPWFWRNLAVLADCDVIVTNALLAEPERGMPLFRLSRGGIAASLTVAAPKRRLGRAAVVSVQPALAQAPFSLDLPPEAVPHFVGACVWYACSKEPDGLDDSVDPLALAARMIRLPAKSPPEP
jgi:hypothetical protein